MAAMMTFACKEGTHTVLITTKAHPRSSFSLFSCPAFFIQGTYKLRTIEVTGYRFA
jgi:FAD synthase